MTGTKRLQMHILKTTFLKWIALRYSLEQMLRKTGRKTQFANFSKPYFDKGKAWDFKTIERNIYISKNKDVVWFDELLATWMGTCRGSGVLEKNNTQWKIKQYVLSVTIPNDSIQKVIKLKK